MKIAVSNKILIRITLIIIFLLICPSNSFPANRIPPKILFDLGISNGTKPGTVGYYWKNGVLFGITVNSPYGLRLGKVFINPNVNFGYSHLQPKKNVVFPIESFGNYGQETITANSAHIFTVICNLSLTVFPEKSRFSPYFYFGLGYLKRSNLTFESNSPIYESVYIKYNQRLATSFGIGCFVRPKKNLYFSFNVGYIGSDKDPRATTMWPIKIGLGIY